MRTALACLIVSAGLLVGCDDSKPAQTAPTPSAGGSGASSGGHPATTMPGTGTPGGDTAGSAGGDSSHKQ